MGIKGKDKWAFSPKQLLRNTRQCDMKVGLRVRYKAYEAAQIFGHHMLSGCAGTVTELDAGPWVLVQWDDKPEPIPVSPSILWPLGMAE